MTESHDINELYPETLEEHLPKFNRHNLNAVNLHLAARHPLWHSGKSEREALRGFIQLQHNPRVRNAPVI